MVAPAFPEWVNAAEDAERRSLCYNPILEREGTGRFFKAKWNMNKSLLEVDRELINVLRPLSDQPLHVFAEELIVLELYRRRQISSGKAAELLGMDRLAFIQFSSRQGIAFFDMSADEFADEVALAEQVLGHP